MATNALTRKQRLRTLEKEIRSGMEEFYYTGMKLREIRDDDLYKEDGFETWKEYCRKRWELSDRRVRELIRASEYREKLPSATGNATGVTGGTYEWSERSIRELTRIPDKKQAARVAKRVIAQVEKSQQEAAKKPGSKPLKLSSSTVKRFVDEDLGIKPKAKAKPAQREDGIRLENYLRSKIGLIEGITENLTEVPADAWELLEESDPGLAERLATACDDLAGLLRS